VRHTAVRADLGYRDGRSVILMPTKFAHAVILAMSAESFAASCAFAYIHNWKLAAYWFLVASINAVASSF
jgi:hypothetical protein